MVKYMRLFLFCITALIGASVVGYATNSKLTELRAKRSALPYDFVSLKDRERQLKCMADNIYHEAGSESAEGKIAVAQVVMNRVSHPSFPKDPCQVIYQRTVFMEKVVCQFSWFCDGSARRPMHRPMWDESYEAAKMVLLEGFRLPGLKDALYYHADYVNPQWQKEKVAKIGRHIFYKPKEKTNARI
jgi:spore germination cell wall hydrolase CwlJ-like protein